MSQKTQRRTYESSLERKASAAVRLRIRDIKEQTRIQESLEDDSDETWWDYDDYDDEPSDSE